MAPQHISDFFGRWSLSREIHDRRAGQVNHAEGSVWIAQTPKGVSYVEDLVLYLPGQTPLKATRRYLWQETSGGISVSFEDGRFFHHIALGQALAQDHHDCAPDSYDVAYQFTDWPIWHAEWSVTGPRKDYVMLSQMRRMPGVS